MRVGPPITREQAAAEAAAAGPLSATQSVESPPVARSAEVEDPEIPVSVVGHGLIVSLAYRPERERAEIELTFTAMGCPAMEFIEDDIRRRLLREADVDEVHDRGRVGPGLDTDRIRDDARSRMREPGDRGMSRERDQQHQVWEVFARKEYEQPLHHVGTVTEDDEDLALVCARARSTTSSRGSR